MIQRSLAYRITEFAVACLGYKKIFQYNAVELRDFLEKNKGRQRRAPPAYIGKKHDLVRQMIGGKPCYIITPKGKDSREKAALFIHGGGYILEAHPIHWRAASLLVDRIGIPVWFPVYPLFPDYAISDANAMVTAVYAKMLERFPPGGITVLGDSAGAALAITLCHHINKQEKALPMPGKLALISPVMIIEDDETMLGEMRRLDSVDVMLSMTFMDSMRELFNLDAGRDNYFHSMFYGDFSRFPRTRVFSGTFECGYPQAAAFVERLKAGGIPVEFYPGDGMMHVWPYIPFAPECAKALERVFAVIRDE
jgi:acetyl esterase/lipase